MQNGSSEMVREVAADKYIKPAIQSGSQRFSVAVKDVIRELVAQGFPPANTPQVCTALRKREFLRDFGLEIESVDGPPSKTSTTVVYHYRIADRGPVAMPISSAGESRMRTTEEDPDAWAFRVTEKIRGLLKSEIAALGGAEGFIRWVRSEDEESE